MRRSSSYTISVSRSQSLRFPSGWLIRSVKLSLDVGSIIVRKRTVSLSDSYFEMLRNIRQRVADPCGLLHLCREDIEFVTLLGVLVRAKYQRLAIRRILRK